MMNRSVRRRLGNISITALCDGQVEVSPEIAGKDQAGLVRQILTSRGLPELQQVSVNAFLLQTGGHNVLVDTGAGDKLGPKLGQLEARLAEVGIDRRDIRTILLTHMHPDHSNGLTDRDGNALFPNAELVVQSDELAHWLDDRKMAQASPRERRDNFEAARRAVTPYEKRLRLFKAGDVLPFVKAVPLPGHTPGHTGYLVEAPGASLLIWGDVVHVPVIQIQRPDIAVALDTDRWQAVSTRKQILYRAASKHIMVGGMHLDFPGFVHHLRR